MELEKQLPDARYITYFKKKQTEKNIKIRLSLEFPEFSGKADELQKRLIENNIPIDSLYKSKTFFDEDKIVYKGKSENLGEYLIKTEFLDREKITLKATKKGEDVGKMPDLLKVLKEYADSYQERQRLLKEEILKHSIKT